MYLTKKIYVGANYDHRNVTGKIDIKVEGKPLKVDFKKVSYIEQQAGYWRKDNHIHKWFVDNCQDGEDDCRSAYVSKEQLGQLREVCKKVSENHELAEELLPTQSGFFFGGTDFDEYYFQSLSETIKIIDEALKDSEDCEFEYQSSW